MKKFEYQQIEYSNYPSTEELNKEGIEGWELIQIFATKKTYFDNLLERYLNKNIYIYIYIYIYIVTFKREI